MGEGLFDLSGRVAVVTGGTTGLGREIALGMAAAGADVVASSRRQEHVDEVADAIEVQGRRTLRVPCDVLDRGSLERLHDAVLKAFGKIDILVNAAGITQKVPTLEVTDADWSRVMETNMTGTMRACQIFGATMAKAGYGRIINITSIAGFQGFYRVAAYAASKSAVASFTKTLAIELAQSGVNVNAIAPGVFPTPLNMTLINGTPRGEEILQRTPMHRFGNPREVVGPAIFLASAAAAFITGEVIAVDGGFMASGVNQ
ncbi:MAG TPA: glucose 1-dehydrogenase [Terracidiphilus sp.]|jgi:NAD(P)-dependent dehydrogenase (short-subunit alcohol dehydrogenase family)|nr:glucose 1-dehydrogenase [Terracidiphilus sp.]